MARPRSLATALAAFAAAAALGLAAASTPVPRGWTDPALFEGGRFHQPEPHTSGFGDWLERKLTAGRGPWRDFTDTPPGPPPPRCVEDGRLRVTFVNHATLLVQMDGLNLLTDPNWGNRSAPVVGVKRHRPPGLRFEDLPPIDAVLVSHDHHDHMDLATLRRLEEAWHPAVFAGLGNARFLAGNGVPGARDLDWWQTAALAPGVTVTAVPARHGSGRSLFGADRTLWCGFVVSGPSGSFYFAGDTGWGAHFAAIAEVFPGLRLAMLPIGGFKPVRFMREQHIGPEDALEAMRLLGAGAMVPMHFGTFPNASDAELEPAETLRGLLAQSPDMASRVFLLDNGQSAEVPPASVRLPPANP